MAKVTPDEWNKRIERAYKWKQRVGGSDKWPMYHKYLRGDFSPTSGGTPVPGSQPLSYNIIYMLAHTMIPNTYFRNPYAMVSPRKHWTGPLESAFRDIQAKVVEAIANWLMQEIDLKKAMKSADLNTFICGRGLLKIGFDSEFGVLERDEDAFSDLEYTTQFEGGDVEGKRLENRPNVKPGMPWVLSQHPSQYLVPYGTTDLDNCAWLDHIVYRELSNLKVDSKYKNTSGLEGSHVDASLMMTDKLSFLNEMGVEMVDWIELHEIHDVQRRQVITLVRGQGDDPGKFIRGPERDLLQIEGLNFVDIGFNEDPECYWWPSDVKLLEDVQLELNETIMQARAHRQISLLMAFVMEGALTDDEISKITRGEVMPIIKTKGINLADAIKLVQPHIPQDLPLWGAHLRSNAQELMGIGRNQAGQESRSSRRTAKEASLIQLGSDIRMDERRDMMGDALQKVIRKVLQVAFKFWPKGRVVQVVGFDGAKYWVEYDPKELEYEFDLKVDVESMRPQSKALRRQDIVQLMQALGKNPRVNLDYLMKLLLREFDWVDAMRVLPESQETMGGPMGMGQFQQQQQGLLQNPQQLQQRASANANTMAVGGAGGQGL